MTLMNRYKASMDKIVLSDEMKAKVMNAALSHKKNRKKIWKYRNNYVSLLRNGNTLVLRFSVHGFYFRFS